MAYRIKRTGERIWQLDDETVPRMARVILTADDARVHALSLGIFLDDLVFESERERTRFEATLGLSIPRPDERP